jgi:hypothetical protein
MTFEEWFSARCGHVEEGSFLRMIAKEAWEAALQEAEDTQRELQRLTEYDRSVFGDPDQGISGASGYTFRGL